MKITLDRRTCTCWEPACESHFSWHFLRDEITPIDCTLVILEDGKEERTFLIKDRDGIESSWWLGRTIGLRLSIPGSWPGRSNKLV